MSDILRCPFCDGILEQSPIYNINSYVCTDLACKGYFMTATKDMWQELILTRKALEIAKDAIDVISLKYHKDTPSIFLIKYAQNAKDQITALEQKDIK